MGRRESQSAVLPDMRQVEVPHVDENPGVTTWARGNLGNLGREREKRDREKRDREKEKKERRKAKSNSVHT